MPKPNIVLVVLLGLSLSGIAAAWADEPTVSNIRREKNWADQTVGSIVVGEAVWLPGRGRKFLALYAPPAQASTWGVILLHGRGVHPAWGFLDSLRADIAEAGYHTLSLQLPILVQDAKFGSYGQTFPEAYERIETGIRYLKDKGVQHIVLLGHSTGSMTAVAYAAKHPQTRLAGIEAVGLSTFVNGPDSMQPVRMLPSVHVPILDIYGGNDLYEVVTYNQARKQAAAAAGNKDYRAVRIPDSDHFVTDHYDALKKASLEWLASISHKK